MFISFLLTFNYLFNKLVDSRTDDEIIKYIVSNGFNNSLDEYNLVNLKNMSSTDFLVKYSLGIDLKNDSNVVVDENDHIDDFVSDYIEDPSPVDITNPLVYIYNSHQTEAYEKEGFEAYNITPTVMITSYILRERLNDLGIPTIVETGNISEILNKNNWNYSKSYQASRLLIDEAIKNNSSIKYFIDIHRDSVSHELSTLNMNNTNYAKLMFVIGSEYDTYESNLEFAKSLRSELDLKYPNLCRGIAIKSGKGVNGVYNQDISSRAILIEVGSEYSTIEEVNNTTGLLAEILFSYIEGDNNN